MNPTHTLLALPAFALAFLVSCANEDPAGLQPSPSASRTDDELAVGAVLKNMVTAQEAYFVENQRYTGSVGDLEAQGLNPGDVQASVVSASATAYCMTATRGGLTLYYDSVVGVPSTTACA